MAAAAKPAGGDDDEEWATVGRDINSFVAFGSKFDGKGVVSSDT
jgi:hypothetical protein